MPKRNPLQFDLTPENWRELAEQGTLKLRVPCRAQRSFTADRLDQLGLAPEDGEVLAQALRNSRERVWSAVGPVCSDALGGNEAQAWKMGVSACRRLILQEARRDGTALSAFRQVAASMAGDAESREEELGSLEQVLLALAREQALLESEIGSALGPEEAHRLVFSESAFCFEEAIHQL